MLADVTISNGLAWTADGSRAYYIDTPTGRIDLFDADGAAGLAGRRPFAAIDPADGYPDGLTLDADDRVWVALWGGAAVRCYDVDGSLVEQVELPVPKVTACTFGGPELDELYITTSREGDEPAPTRRPGPSSATGPGCADGPSSPSPADRAQLGVTARAVSAPRRRPSTCASYARWARPRIGVRRAGGDHL